MLTLAKRGGVGNGATGKWAKHHPVDRVIAGRTYRDHDDKLHPTHHKLDGRRNNVMAGVVGARRLLRG